MIPQAAITHFRNLCTDGFVEQWHRLAEAQHAFDAKERMGRGQGYAARLAGLYREQLSARGQVVLSAAKAIHRSFDLQTDEGTASELKALAETTLNAQLLGLRGAYDRHLQPFGITPVPDPFAHHGVLVHVGVVNALSRYLWEEQNVPKQKPPEPGLTMTFNAPVGAVQTGANAVAHVTQSWSAENVAAVVEALANFKAQLQAASGVDVGVRADLVRDVESASAELAATSPNPGRLTRWLGGVGASIQTVGALQPAWDAVKVGLRTLGIPL